MRETMTTWISMYESTQLRSCTTNQTSILSHAHVIRGLCLSWNGQQQIITDMVSGMADEDFWFGGGEGSVYTGMFCMPVIVVSVKFRRCVAAVALHAISISPLYFNVSDATVNSSVVATTDNYGSKYDSSTTDKHKSLPECISALLFAVCVVCLCFFSLPPTFVLLCPKGSVFAFDHILLCTWGLIEKRCPPIPILGGLDRPVTGTQRCGFFLCPYIFFFAFLTKFCPNRGRKSHFFFGLVLVSTSCWPAALHRAGHCSLLAMCCVCGLSPSWP